MPFKHRKMGFIARMTKHQNRLPRGYGVSNHRDFQKLTGHGPEQPAVGDPCLGRRVGVDDLQRSLSQAHTFHESVISPLSLAKQEGSVSHAHLLWCHLLQALFIPRDLFPVLLFSSISTVALSCAVIAGAFPRASCVKLCEEGTMGTWGTSN